EADGRGVAGAAGDLDREPTLALARIIVGKRVGGTGVPAGPHAITQLHAHLRFIHNVADVGGTLAVLGDDPELLTDESDSHRDAARLAGFAAGGFEDGASGDCNANREHRLDGRVEEVFLQNVDYVA